MCGIATISIGRKSRGRIPYPKLRELARELLIGLEVRGYDASGIAIFNEPGEEESVVFKMPLRASRLVVRPKFSGVLEKIGLHTHHIMLHSRWASVGNTTDNFNNHPIITESIVGIHNGTLVNDTDVAKELNLKREGNVDSEVFFRTFLHFIEKGESPEQAAQMTSKLLRGAFTGAAIDTRYPERMILFKCIRPLTILKLPFYDMIITTSEVRFYDEARKKLKIHAKDDVLYAKDGAGIIIDVDAGTKRITTELKTFELPVKENIKSLHYWERQRSAPWLEYFGG